MASKIPYCNDCRERRDAKSVKKKDKGKGKAQNKTRWGQDDHEDEDENDWGGGEPGIMKVSRG
jgi:NAD-dependent histone deacetylase SIR2